MPSTNGTCGVITGVEGYSNPQAAIGFISADAFDAVGSTAQTTPRTQMSELAFEWYGQTKAYYADSDPSAYDRRNVRDGHYAIWGYEHMLATVDGSGAITNPKAANFIGWINGTKVDPSFDPVVVEAGAGTIPTCAMKVQRYVDGGPLDDYTPADPAAAPSRRPSRRRPPPAAPRAPGPGPAPAPAARPATTASASERDRPMRNSMTKFVLLIALGAGPMLACSSSSNSSGTGGTGGHLTGTGGHAGAAGSGAAGSGAAGSGAAGSGAAGSGAAGQGGGVAGGGGTAAGGAGGGTGGAGGSGNAGGASAVNAAIINAPTSGGVTPTRTAPTVTYPTCP